MKKILIILLCAMFIFNLTGCDKKEESTNNDSSNKTNETNNSSSDSQESSDSKTAVSYLVDKANKEDLSYQDAETKEQVEMWTFTHEKTAQTDALTDYRYIGSFPSNYVTFNNELWRIIGVFTVDDGTGKKEQRIKLISEEIVDGTKWDSNNGTDWTKATLNNYLNGTYLEELSKESQDMIDNSVWYLGGSISRYYSRGFVEATPNTKDFYINERGTETNNSEPNNYTGKVGLMYPSDYGYATSGSRTTNRNACYDLTLYYYSNSDYSDCYQNDWLFASKYSNEWTIIPTTKPSFGTDEVFTIENMGGAVTSETDYTYVFSRPVVYLKSSVKITSGDGTKNNPYKLEM